MLVNTTAPRRREAGFTLVELLVTMLIVTIGLLGLAKLQATAVSNTAVARTRALMTYQAESLAGMIRANKAFWVTSGNVTSFPSFAVNAQGQASDSGLMQVPPTSNGTCANFTTGSCGPANLAYDDMYTWANRFNNGSVDTSAFPGASATITCVPATGSTCLANPTTPHGYDITLTWQQKIVAINASTNNSTSMTQPVSMVMHVQP